VYRRPLAAGLAALAVASALSALAPESTPTVPVVVAVRDVPTGGILDDSSLKVSPMAARALPPGVFGSIDEVRGSQLAVPAAAGAPITATSLVGPGLLTGAAPGTVAVPVRPSDADVGNLLAPGQLVDVVLSEGNGYEREVRSRVIASAVPVLWVPEGDGGSWVGSGGESGLVVVAASQAESAALAAAPSRGRVFLVLVGAGAGRK
jgi:Flp pilus assembly protein CpaB